MTSPLMENEYNVFGMLPLDPTPLQILSFLTYVMEQRRPTNYRMDAYYDNRQPLAYLSDEVKASIQGRLLPLNISWGSLCLDSISERLDVSGFKTPDGKPDESLWTMWQDNDLDEANQLVINDSLIYGRGYALCWDETGSGTPLITVESPLECITWNYPGTRRVQWGLKRWFGDIDRIGRCTLFTETKVHRFRTEGTISDPSFLESFAGQWVPDGDPLPNPLKTVPLVCFPNRPRTGRPDGVSELDRLVPILDSINRVATDLLVSTDATAATRRWATGVDLPEKMDEDGNPTGEVDTEKAFQTANYRVWMLEPSDAKIGQFPAADLSGFVSVLEYLQNCLGAIGCLPPHYVGLLTGGSQPTNADAIRSSESRLVRVCGRKQATLSGPWETIMRLGAAIRDGRFDPSLNLLRTSWLDASTATIAQSSDAAVKLVGAGILDNTGAQELIGRTPQQMAESKPVPMMPKPMQPSNPIGASQ